MTMPPKWSRHKAPTHKEPRSTHLLQLGEVNSDEHEVVLWPWKVTAVRGKDEAVGLFTVERRADVLGIVRDDPVVFHLRDRSGPTLLFTGKVFRTLSSDKPAQLKIWAHGIIPLTDGGRHKLDFDGWTRGRKAPQPLNMEVCRDEKGMRGYMAFSGRGKKAPLLRFNHNGKIRVSHKRHGVDGEHYIQRIRWEGTRNTYPTVTVSFSEKEDGAVATDVSPTGIGERF